MRCHLCDVAAERSACVTPAAACPTVALSSPWDGGGATAAPQVPPPSQPPSSPGAPMPCVKSSSRSMGCRMPTPIALPSASFRVQATANCTAAAHGDGDTAAAAGPASPAAAVAAVAPSAAGASTLDAARHRSISLGCRTFRNAAISLSSPGCSQDAMWLVSSTSMPTQVGEEGTQAGAPATSAATATVLPWWLRFASTCSRRGWQSPAVACTNGFPPPSGRCTDHAHEQPNHCGHVRRMCAPSSVFTRSIGRMRRETRATSRGYETAAAAASSGAISSSRTSAMATRTHDMWREAEHRYKQQLRRISSLLRAAATSGGHRWAAGACVEFSWSLRSITMGLLTILKKIKEKEKEIRLLILCVRYEWRTALRTAFLVAAPALRACTVRTACWAASAPVPPDMRTIFTTPVRSTLRLALQRPG